MDRARSKDGKIVYYEDDDYVYWKVIWFFTHPTQNINPHNQLGSQMQEDNI